MLRRRRKKSLGGTPDQHLRAANYLETLAQEAVFDARRALRKQDCKQAFRYAQEAHAQLAAAMEQTREARVSTANLRTLHSILRRVDNRLVSICLR